MSKKPKDARPPLFTIRADQELWDALDEIQISEVPVKSRSDIVKDLIYREQARIRKGRK
jgi:hypothetical protein